MRMERWDLRGEMNEGLKLDLATSLQISNKTVDPLAILIEWFLNLGLRAEYLPQSGIGIVLRLLL
jgi:hypothetical protein